MTQTLEISKTVPAGQCPVSAKNGAAFEIRRLRVSVTPAALQL